MRQHKPSSGTPLKHSSRQQAAQIQSQIKNGEDQAQADAQAQAYALAQAQVQVHAQLTEPNPVEPRIRG